MNKKEFANAIIETVYVNPSINNIEIVEGCIDTSASDGETTLAWECIDALGLSRRENRMVLRAFLEIELPKYNLTRKRHK